MGQGENGPAFSRTALISAENMNYSSYLDDREQLKQAFGDVRLMGRMGSHPSSPTNLGGVDGLTGGRWEAIVERRRRAYFCRGLRVSGSLGVPKVVAGILARIRGDTQLEGACLRAQSGDQWCRRRSNFSSQ